MIYANQKVNMEFRLEFEQSHCLKCSYALSVLAEQKLSTLVVIEHDKAHYKT